MSDDWARPLVHWELVARDPNTLADFYRRLFEWEITDGAVTSVAAGLGGPSPDPVDTSAKVTDRASRSGSRSSTSKRRWVLAAQLDGQAVTEPFDPPGAPTLALIRDPEGKDVMLVQQ